MINCFPGKEIEWKMTLHPEWGVLEDLTLVVRACVNALCNITTSVSEEMTGVINNPVHRFGWARKFRVQWEEPMVLEIWGKRITFPVWWAIFKSSSGWGIWEREAKLHLVSHDPPREIGLWFITAEHWIPEYLGYYLKTKMGYDITTKSGRIFHICVDKCIIPWKNTPPLYQIEVEYKYSPDSLIGETLENIQREIDEIIHTLSPQIHIPHEIGWPKKGKWLLEALKH